MVRIFFYQTHQLGGWSYSDVLILLGIYNTLQGMIDFVLRPNMPRLLLHIRMGTLDYVLTKPVDSMFFVSLRHQVFWRLIDVVLGIGLTIYGLVQKQFLPTIVDVSFFILSILAALVIIYSLWMLLMTTAFWVIRMDDLSFLFNSFFQTSQFPITMYKGWLRMVLTYLLPAAFITFTPASALIGLWDWRTTLVSIVVAIVFFWLARRFWKFALANYTSASS